MKRSTTPDCVVTHAGIDYHQKFSMVTLGDEKGQVVGTERVPNDKQAIKKFFDAYPQLNCAVESCRGYEWYVDYLKELGHTVHLANPLQTKLIVQSRCKTDKIDSRVLMELLAIGFLPTCYQPTLEERELRERLRWRAHLVRNATRMKVRIHSLLAKENLELLVERLFNQEGRKFLSQVTLSGNRTMLLKEHLSILDYLEHFIEQENSWIVQTVKSNTDAQLLKTIPGIGDLTALILVAELGNIKRFKDSGQVASYVGLVPSVSSSAAKRYLGPITKQGPKMLRWVLVQAAWQGVRHSYDFRTHFIAVSRRCGRNSAIVSVARKMLKVAYRVLRDKKPFNAAFVGSKS